jgi:hypothetical protein
MDEVSDKMLAAMVEYYSELSESFFNHQILSVLLELQRRRAKDKAKADDGR